ncbi:hypothetical protein BCR34DRAFT_556661 [Clohesyomyces aquaticus]|uniref:C2H2-type domain-containing protein n=1 Tax=Clohesyomyces aquaticus TaxID=1231657 RepID=A0A1Y2A2Q0_9PLEO|nr:hypothetical protein BCR34DRAFT_556661 [Clohesyomyces aquaticus]
MDPRSLTPFGARQSPELKDEQNNVESLHISFSYNQCYTPESWTECNSPKSPRGSYSENFYVEHVPHVDPSLAATPSPKIRAMQYDAALIPHPPHSMPTPPTLAGFPYSLPGDIGFPYPAHRPQSFILNHVESPWDNVTSAPWPAICEEPETWDYPGFDSEWAGGKAPNIQPTMPTLLLNSTSFSSNASTHSSQTMTSMSDYGMESESDDIDDEGSDIDYEPCARGSSRQRSTIHSQNKEIQQIYTQAEQGHFDSVALGELGAQLDSETGRLHFRKKSGLSIYPCNWQTPRGKCTTRFSRIEHLKRHHQAHEGKIWYYCKVPKCPKRFNRKDNLNDHYFTHVEREGSTGKNDRYSLAYIEKLTKSRQLSRKLRQKLRKAQELNAKKAQKAKAAAW